MKIASWNIEGRLSNLARGSRGTPAAIVSAIHQLDADILVHPEAFGTKPPIAAAIETALRDQGYHSVSVPYDDSLERGEHSAVTNPHLRIMSRMPIISSEFIRPGDMRTMIAVTVQDSDSGRNVRIMGVHLDDRSEQYRLIQVYPLIEYINSSDISTVVMGDFNAMPPNTLKSLLVHSFLFKGLAMVIPHRHMRNVLRRLSDMATGTTIASIVNQTSLSNTDPSYKPTTTPKMRKMEWMPSIRFAKIDWIFVSPDIEYKNFSVSPDLGSDHRAVSAEITLKKR